MRYVRALALSCLLVTIACQGAPIPPTATSTPEAPTVSPTFTPTLISPTFPPIDSTPTPIIGNIYYISPGGSDANSGRTETDAWLTLDKVNQTAFLPGDVIRFERGGAWTGELDLSVSGAPGLPIVFTSYGDGPLPVISNPGSETNFTSAIHVTGQWLVVDGLKAAGAQDAGVYVQASLVVVQNVEATEVGIGIKVSGQNNLITRNYIHDLHMVKNTPGGTDDYGAIGIALGNASRNEISYNRIANCIAPSFDFGSDGGVIEFYGQADSNYIHHNWGSDSNGFLEVGGGSAVDNVLAYNVSVNNGGFTSIHLSDAWASEVRNFRVENNTIVETGAPDWMLIKFAGEPTPETFMLRNNILYVSGFQGIANKTNFTHSNNLYFLIGVTKLGFDLGLGEFVADPLFVDLARRDFRLQAESPAIDAGLDLGYLLDFINHPLPSGRATDLGAFEFQFQ